MESVLPDLVYPVSAEYRLAIPPATTQSNGEIPMRSIAVINQKGGVGKTTTAVNLSAALADAGRRVCVIDLDPQAHASLHLGLSVVEGNSMYEVLCGRESIADARREVSENLHVIPSNLDLAAAEMELAGEVGREMILRDKLAVDEEDYDYLILDCPPSLGVLTVNALVAVEEVFLPLQPHFLALHGLSKLLRTVEIVSRRLNNRLRLSGTVLCMYDSTTRLAAEVSSDVSEFIHANQSVEGVLGGAKFFETRIRRNVRLAEAPSFGQSIFQYAPTSNGAEDYRAFAAEVLMQEQDAFQENHPATLKIAA
jgi:chromosome partitioning protein